MSSQRIPTIGEKFDDAAYKLGAAYNIDPLELQKAYSGRQQLLVIRHENKQWNDGFVRLGASAGVGTAAITGLTMAFEDIATKRVDDHACISEYGCRGYGYRFENDYSNWLDNAGIGGMALLAFAVLAGWKSWRNSGVKKAVEGDVKKYLPAPSETPALPAPKLLA